MIRRPPRSTLFPYTTLFRSLHPDPAGAVVRHGLHAALALGEELGDGAEVLLGDVDGHALHRLVQLAVDDPRDDPRLADGPIETPAAHLFDHDPQRQPTTAPGLPSLPKPGRHEAQR